MMTNTDAIICKMNEFGKNKIPFLFIIDFNCTWPVIIPLSEIKSENILYNINGFTNTTKPLVENKEIHIKKFPLAYNDFLNSYSKVQKHLHFGNSYLVNLTFETPIKINLTLKEIFYLSRSKYKLLFNDDFVVFSPEIFVKIDDTGVISSYPMKGTIDATTEKAEEKIINDKKEFAEHCTIVDLIRNDLSMVAKNVYVKRFRYIDRIETSEKPLLQVSSEICGQLPKLYYENIGTIIAALLPAGSVSGAPKNKTIEIINESETYSRKYYTGIFGYFDGSMLDSGVMIRFIEKRDGKYFYKSGGGITVNSNPENEYQEMIDKIYVPAS
ncbi:MAG TPA: aminodeoxychorismate synthase component I [Bacteroidales bacterium]|nr:aminodeoxychorismate synthase component I [Bacteroidales bacterium]HPS16654.1 aminodeoxychorismate synthase component I [Bacteroidales bacterium]